MMTIIVGIVCFSIGSIFGIFVHALCLSAAVGDEEIEYYMNHPTTYNNEKIENKENL